MRTIEKLRKMFLFHLKSSFRSQNIQMFVIFSLPFHTFRGISYDVMNWLAFFGMNQKPLYIMSSNLVR